jgi:hypothetical protein
MRRGIAANPYIAEGLTGRTVLTEHLYWHASNVHGPEWAVDYLESAACSPTPCPRRWCARSRTGGVMKFGRGSLRINELLLLRIKNTLMLMRLNELMPNGLLQRLF